MSLPLVRQATKRRVVLQCFTRTHLTKCTTNHLLLRHNSTAAVATTPDPQHPPPHRHHIILPNPGLDTFKSTARVLPSNVAEQFAILKACIMSGSMVRAERVMNELFKTKPEEMKLFADVGLYNSFLNGFMETPVSMTKQSLKWFDVMRSYGVQADANTFAIIVKGFLKAKSYHTARALLTEMTDLEGISVDMMLQSEYLDKADITLFREMISASQGSKSSSIENLLRDLESGTDKILGKSTEPIIKDTTEVAEHSKVAEEILPEVKPTSSIGVQFLQEQLAALRDPAASSKMDPFELQLGLEQQGYEMALQKLLHTKEQSLERGDTLNALNLTPLKRAMWQWHQNMVPLIEEEIQRCDASTVRETDRRSYGPFLKLLPAKTLSIVTILELLRLHNSSGIGDGMKTARAIIDVGKAVEMEYNAVQIKKTANKSGSFLSGSGINNDKTNSLFASNKLFSMAVKKAHKEKEEQKLANTEWNPVWPSTTRAKVGSVLTSLLLEAAKIPVPSWNPENGMKIIEQIPAFFHTYQYVHGKRVGIIKFSEQLTSILSREPVRDTLHPRLLPMLVRPRPWVSYNSGGYLSTKSVCMRIKDSAEQLIYLTKASEQDHLTDVLAGLDVLGSTKWKVNKDVFKIVLECWNSGKPIGDIPPPVNEVAVLPPKPENYDTDPKAKFNWVTAVKEIQTTEKNNHSLRCDVNYKVETARSFLNLPMYFPHNMDFRGRAYPMPPTLNHLGNDLCRGLLHFDEAKPLGTQGWRWLKIHLANLYGYDKHSFTDREKYTTDNMDNILDSVDNPLTGKKWWLEADAPWQCLSACFEVAAAFRSGKPEEFKSQLPVHQDGTCNGLQHYAALGGDLAGARAVNLAAGDRPADVYTGVADMVNQRIDKAAEEGDEYAKILQGNISRKVVKQTVMTNVYGVTFVGARAQIESRLKENPAIPREKTYVLSGYLAKIVFASLGEMFTGAHQIQDWLTDSARRIARSVPLETLQEAGILPVEDESSDAEASTVIQKDIGKYGASVSKRGKKTKAFSARNPAANQMSSVIWTTPLGLPIVQPYRRSGKKQIATLLQTVFIEDPDASRPVNALKQSAAFPPNFIHSLDATHMLMSAVACHKKSITFASVHDSYWTHACDVDVMNEVIRDQFIELHLQPIMENLIAEFKERYKDYRVPHSTLMDKKNAAKKQISKNKPIESESKASSEANELNTAAATLFGDPDALERELERERKKKESEKKDAIKAIFGIGNTSEGEGDDDLNGDEYEEEEESEKETKTSSKKNQYSWEPLQFAPLPPKGEFDINEVKKSLYFFH